MLAGGSGASHVGPSECRKRLASCARNRSLSASDHRFHCDYAAKVFPPPGRFPTLSEEVKGLMAAEQRRAFKEISATKKEDVDGKPSATLDREPQISESKKENTPSLSLAGKKKKQWQWHDYVAVAVGLLFVTAMLFSFRINDWVMRTFTWATWPGLACRHHGLDCISDANRYAHGLRNNSSSFAILAAIRDHGFVLSVVG